MKQGESSTATVLPGGKTAPALSLVEPPSHTEQVESKLEEAREQLLALRRQQEELERQKAELEELRRKQDEYSRGKLEMIEKLTRGLVTLEREQVQAQRLVELCARTTEAFRDYLEQLHAIRDEDWTGANLRAELSAALGIIENARLEYNRARTKLDCLNPAAGQSAVAAAAAEPARATGWEELLRYARIGAAASAPLIVAGTIWLIILLAAR